MEKSCFIYFGDEAFAKFNDVESNFIQPKHYFLGKIFNSLLLNDQKHVLDRVFLGWSCSLFQIGKKLYHKGFWNYSCKDNATLFFESSEFDDIRDASCGFKILLFITKNGDCYCCPETQFNPVAIKSNGENLKVKNVAACDKYDLILTLDGQVFSVEFSDFATPVPVPMPCKVTQITCGKEHILMLSETGRIFSCGFGSRGQLGHGDIESKDQPLLLEALDGVQIISVCAGGWHSAAISYCGDLYMWGWNESGQLGMPCKQLQTEAKQVENIETTCCLPKHVAFKNDVRVTTVSCGSRHSAALTEDGCLWTWGWNAYGQLGQKNCALLDKPEIVTLPDDFIPHELSCRFWGTLVSGTLKAQ